MRIFNVGIREVLLLLVILLILFGPNQLRENAGKAARAIRRFLRSDTWRTFLGIYDDVNSIKDQVIRESGIQEVQDSLRGVNRQLHELDHEFRGQSVNVDIPRPEIPRPPDTTQTECSDSNESEDESTRE